MNAPVNETTLLSMKDQVSEAEWELRVNLAACYRAIAMYGWDDLVFTHISARIPGPEHHFLINPYGMGFDEITASSLVKINGQCEPQHDTPYLVNPAGFTIHGAIHAVREDAGCVIHTHTRAGVGVSAQKRGLLPISQQSSVVMTSLSYHDYEGIAVNPGEIPRLQKNLGGSTYMILRSHGLLTVGKTIGDAFLAMYVLECACQVQVAAQAGGGELIEVDASVHALNKANMVKASNGVGGGALSWPAVRRRVDRRFPGYAV
jgi:ribulose-5-phosphate 4-epimerase/fuculose-1-phosphate aldolase